MKESGSWFRHDANASKDEKLLVLKKLKGREAVAVYWEIIEFLTDQPDHSYPMDLITDAIAPGDEVMAKALSASVEVGLFKVSKTSRLYSTRLIEDMKRHASVCERNRVNAQKRWESRKVSPDAAALRSESDRNANRIESNRIESNRIELNSIYTPAQPKRRVKKPEVEWNEPSQEEREQLQITFGQVLVERELPKCKDHFAAKDQLSRDWAARRRNWMRKALEFMGRASGSDLSRPKGKMTTMQRNRDLIEKINREEQNEAGNTIAVRLEQVGGGEVFSLPLSRVR